MLIDERGFRIWYDEGINPGSEWSEEIARAINSSAIFIVFISRVSIQSPNVKREISFALNKNKLFLPIHLEEVSLPPGLELSMGDIQWVMKWRMSADDYSRKMMKVLPGDCLEKSRQVLAQDVFISNSHEEKSVVVQSLLHINKHDSTDEKTIQELHMPDSFVFIQGGGYLMGSPKGEAGIGDDETQHQVKVGDFYMAKHLVTVAQFETFIIEENYRTDADNKGGSYRNTNRKSGINWRCDTRGELQKDKQHPVIHVSWNDASAYCKWLSKKLNKAFRLPTEAEWEYACRADTTTTFNTGNNLTADQANCNGNYLYQYNHPKGKVISKTTPVGSYPPNGWGLYDLHGNVWEWCLDWYGEKYHDESIRQKTVDNLKHPETLSYRVLRGGCWNGDARSCRSANRTYINPVNRFINIGFRLVVVP